MKYHTPLTQLDDIGNQVSQLKIAVVALAVVVCVLSYSQTSAHSSALDAVSENTKQNLETVRRNTDLRDQLTRIENAIASQNIADDAHRGYIKQQAENLRRWLDAQETTP
jgi:hypothetical protein